ncbi:hypothetical protein SCULI_v1c01590 [Spiroplasma culicicola AES-1]|uniref:Uncharacterized protein n=1 Tax=Spiroplasma culicicola AES-1 TaxID=1276246 RepID=W6A6K1_9MOLU|nr:hypothetical protein SCULI_v1c01590 [Spiroplasma culicicola AES-1]
MSIPSVIGWKLNKVEIINESAMVIAISIC